MRWVFLLASIGSVATLYSVGPRFVTTLAFLLLCANFMILLLHHDDLINRFRERISLAFAGSSDRAPAWGDRHRAIRAPITVRQPRSRKIGTFGVVIGVASVCLLALGITLHFVRL